MIRFVTLALSTALLLAASPALAHVDLAGPGFADSRQILTFSVGHGCTGADTVSITVHVPASVTSVRALTGSFGDPQITADEGGVVTAVTWTKTQTRAADDMYYEFPLRIRVPDAPFTTIYFPTTQVCRTEGGDETTVEWSALPGSGNAEEPAPALHILPPRRAGWNKYTAPVAITDLGVFDDAQIVWVGDAAYSDNPETMALIEAEPGVSVLTSIASGAEIWVKY